MIGDRSWIITLQASILSNFLTNPITRSTISSELVSVDVHKWQLSFSIIFSSFINNCVVVLGTLIFMCFRIEYLMLCMFTGAEINKFHYSPKTKD